MFTRDTIKNLKISAAVFISLIISFMAVVVMLILTGCSKKEAPIVFSEVDDGFVFVSEKTDVFDGTYGLYVCGIGAEGNPWGVDEEGNILGIETVIDNIYLIDSPLTGDIWIGNTHECDMVSADGELKDNNTILVSDGGDIKVFDYEGNQKRTIHVTNGIITNIVNGGYILYKTGDYSEYSHICRFESERLSISPDISGLPEDIDDIFESGSDDNNLLYYNHEGAYAYSIADNNVKKLFDWQELNLSHANKAWKADEDTYYVEVINVGTGLDEIYRVCKKDPKEISEKKELVIGALGAYFGDFVIDYNNSHDDVHVTVRDYFTEFDNDFDLAEDRLRIELVSDNPPDILYDMNLGPLRYELAKKGAFVDLTGYVEKDEDISLEDYYSEVIETGTYGDFLWEIPKFFTLETLVIPSGELNDTEKWTTDRFIDYLEKYPNARVRSQGWWMNDFFYNNSDYFVDEATGECYFESDEFKRLLKRVKEENDNDHKIRGEWPVERGVYSTKEKTISHINLNELDFSSRVIDSFDGNADFIGYPTKEGDGKSVIETFGGFAILSTSRNKDEAWAFLKEFLLCDPDKTFLWGICSEKAYVEKEIEEELKLYRTTGPSIVKSGAWYEDGYYGFEYENYEHDLTQEGVDALFDTLSKSEQRSETCYALYSIICEESEAYFLGQKDLDEVCRIIQSRATLMMSERMIGNE